MRKSNFALGRGATRVSAAEKIAEVLVVSPGELFGASRVQSDDPQWDARTAQLLALLDGQPVEVVEAAIDQVRTLIRVKDQASTR